MEAELVFVPAPVLGHIVSTVEMAKLLVRREQRLSITVLVMSRPSNSASTSFVRSLTSEAIERVRVVVLPPGEPVKSGSESPLAPMLDFVESHMTHVRDVVAESTRSGRTRLAGFVIDMFCIAVMDIAREFNVPTYMFFTSSAAYLGVELYLQSLSDDSGHDLTEFVNSVFSVPCFAKPVPANALPSVYFDKGSKFVVEYMRKLREPKGVMINTFMELESCAIKSLSTSNNGQEFYAVGPILNLNGAVEKHQNYGDIMQWLDDQPPSSVVFLCFGSMGSFGEVQVKEIACALERSGTRFLWSLRRPALPGANSRIPGEYEDPGEVLPEGFLDRTAGRGKLIGWAPQVAILSHSAVGGFVSHCGWNSILESLWFSVPVAAWPMYAEQQTNAFQLVVDLRLGVEVKIDYKNDAFDGSGSVLVTAEEIERGIRQLMDEKNEIRKQVKEIGEKARAAVMEGGSSYNSMGRLVEDIMENVGLNDNH